MLVCMLHLKPFTGMQFAHPVHVAEEEGHVGPLKPPKIDWGAALKIVA